MFTLQCSTIPEPPTTITSANNADMIDLAWSDPVDNGTPITGYRIFIQETVAGDY